MTKSSPPRGAASSRRGAATLLAASLSAALLLTGCGGGGADEEPTGSSEAPAAAGYPVTVDTAYGEITLERRPERIVALSAAYVDMLASIDERPVAFSAGRWTDGRQLLTDHPWLEGIDVELLDPSLAPTAFEVSPEALAAHAPDLILGSIHNVPEDQYAQLSEIAPTFVGTEPDQATDWRDYLGALGTLTGRTEEAAEALAGVETAYAAARERLPGLQGRTYNSTSFSVETNDFGFGSGTWLDGLGLVPAENQPPPFSGADRLSLENIDQLAADVLVTGAAPGDSGDVRAALEADPRFAELPAHRNGTVIFNDIRTTLASASAPGPLSLTWLLERVVPQLEESALNTSGR